MHWDLTGVHAFFRNPKKIQSVTMETFTSGKMSKLFTENESRCYENLKNIQENINTVMFIRNEKNLPGQDLTINHLFLTDKDLGKRCAKLFVKQISYQHKLFIQTMKDLNLLWHESDASDRDLQVIENDGIACISVKGRECVINCESLVKLTDELLKVTGFDKLPLLGGKVGREVDDESDIFRENSTVNENKTTQHCEDLDSLSSTHSSETDVSSQGFVVINGLDCVNDGNSIDHCVNSNSDNSKSSESERKKDRLVDDESDISDNCNFSKLTPVIENEATQDCEDLDSLSTHSSETDVSSQGFVNDEHASDYFVNSNSGNSESDASDGKEGRVVDGESVSSESIIFSELTSVSDDKPTQDSKDLDSLSFKHTSETDISSQGFVDDDNASDYSVNSSSENSESDESEGHVGNVVDDKSDSSESVIFPELPPFSKNKTKLDCELLSTDRFKTDISSQDFANDDNASDYSVNSNSDNSESDESEGNVGRVVDEESDSGESVVFREPSPPISENMTTQDCEAYKGNNKSSLSQSQSVSASLYEKGYTFMSETVLQKYDKLRQYYLKNRSSLKGNVVIVYTSTAGVIKTVSCATNLEARQKAYSLHDVLKDPFPVVFIWANKIEQNSSTVCQEKTPSILGTLHSEQREFPHFRFYIDTGADEGSVGFNPDIIKDFVFTVANINGSLEPAVLCKFTSECTESEDVHVFDVDKESGWNAIGFSHLEKCVLFLDMKNNICLLRKHKDVTRWETEEETKIIFKKAS